MTIRQTNWDLPLPVKLRAEDFTQLQDAGGLTGYAKTELVDGVIVWMNAQYSRHSTAKTDLGISLQASVRALGLRMIIETSVKLAPDTVVEPDIVLVQGEITDRIIPASQLRLVVEIADSSAAYDLGAKARLYALTCLPEYWVVDLPDGVVHQFTEPNMDGSWGKHGEAQLGRPITARTIPGLTVDTAGLG